MGDIMPGVKAREIEYVVTDSGCHICTSHKPRSDGKYYSIKINGKVLVLHRVMYERKYGAIPSGLIARHKCDNVLCINPEHIELGTNQDNMNDMVERNRSLKGSKNNSSKLTEEVIIEIRNSNLNKFELAEKYQVSERTIRDIIMNRAWKHI
jgi:hypothetical protein